MRNRFEMLMEGTASISKSIRIIKNCRMGSIGLQGSDVLCIYYLNAVQDGLTAAQLSKFCNEDKAGISRMLKRLEREGLIEYAYESEKRRYRAKACLTEIGRKSAERMEMFIDDAINATSIGISDEERAVFYTVLFKIADNLKLQAEKLQLDEEDYE